MQETEAVSLSKEGLTSHQAVKTHASIQDACKQNNACLTKQASHYFSEANCVQIKQKIQRHRQAWHACTNNGCLCECKQAKAKLHIAIQADKSTGGQAGTRKLQVPASAAGSRPLLSKTLLKLTIEPTQALALIHTSTSFARAVAV